MAVKKSEKRVKTEDSKPNLSSESKRTDLKSKPSLNKFVFPLFLLLVLVLLGFWVYSNLSFFVIATVNGKPIWRTELIKELEKRSGKQTASYLLNKALVYEEARNKNINVSDDDVKNLFDKYDQQLKNQGTSLKDALAAQGLTEEDYKSELKYELIVRKLLEDKIAVSDDEIKQYYNTNKSQFNSQSLEDVKEDIRQVLSDQKLFF